ncbi:hypothetical protein Gpo141_00009878, partial [Globisporangium polare]
MIYAKNVFRAIIAISSVATAAHANPAPRVNTWSEFGEGQGHGANDQGPRGFASRLLDTLNTYGGAGATATAVASPSNYGGKKKTQANALRGLDSPRNDSKFATASPISTPKNGKNTQNSKTPCPNSVKTAHQAVTVKPMTTPCPNSGKTVQPTLKKANNNDARSRNGNPYSYTTPAASQTPATAAPTSHGNAYGNKGGYGKNGNGNDNHGYNSAPVTSAPTGHGNAYGNKGGYGKNGNGNDNHGYNSAPVTSAPTSHGNAYGNKGGYGKNGN